MTSTMARPDAVPASRLPAPAAWWVAAGLGVLAAIVAFVLVRAWQPGTNDPDSQSSVLFFQRIVARQPLEVTVLTTPKPLLTIVYGVTWNLVHDWRALVWATVVVHGVGVALATRLAARLGGLPAALFVAAALICSSAELAEVAQANSLPWAVAGWAAAGVAATATPRRYGVAGIALLLAGMVRIETWIILGLATVVLMALGIRGIRRRMPTSWPTLSLAWPVLLGWVAVPAQLVHDALLTGNPLYWSSVPSAYTTLVTPHLASVSPIAFGHALVHRYAAMPLLVLLAAAGVLLLVHRRGWAILVGLAGLVAGVLLLLGWLAFRATYISERYYEEPTLGLVLLAAVGASVVAVWLVGRLSRPQPPTVAKALAWPSVAAAVATLIAGAAISQPGPMTADLAGRIADLQASSRNLEAAMPRLRTLTSRMVGPAPTSAAAGPYTRVDPRAAVIYVPRTLQRRIAVELGVQLTWLADSTEAFKADPPPRLPTTGQYVLHVARIDEPAALFRRLEVSIPTAFGSHRLLPIQFQASAFWLLQVQP